MLRNEFERKERHSQRKKAVLEMFKDDADREEFGLKKDKTLRYMTRSIKSYIKELKIKDGQLTEEQDLVKVDDTWLNLYKLMWEPFRLNFQNERI
jgi:hypothetical protein